MGDPKGFMRVKREDGTYRPVCERVKDYRQIDVMCSDEMSERQASRCMDCGVPFCHWACPVGNYIPEWNDFIFNKDWKKAFELLDAANNFPEMTGRLCPALCEYSCVLGINDDAVTIRENELSIIEKAFEEKYIKVRAPKTRTGKKVAVIGSGPAGLACGVQLNRAGHEVYIYEKNEKPGGLLRYGIPDFKLEKSIIDRRLKIMKKEGVKFKTGIDVGVDLDAKKLLKEYDAVCLAGGSETPRDLKLEGRAFNGIYFAMDYLTQSNRRISGEKIDKEKTIDAKDKKVVVIGGGDTGSDCIGTANRQGASCVVQIEVMSKPEECRTKDYPWPVYPSLLKTSPSHEEGSERDWAVLTKRFVGEGNKVKKLECVRVEFKKTPENACPVMKEIPGSEFEIEADIVLLAVGFVHPRHKGLLEDLKIELDERGNVKTGKDYRTSTDKVFSAGDMRKGQSLIVWAISEGRKAAHAIDTFLMGHSDLPSM
ncbi:MAG: glutamate synthase subunit beta [Candidatus Omnitrophica bacterium]|nr:glutamate synthase subunit beta [Candidatus Omnitrophota bacterium]